ncbi:Uncharacterised protein [Yersinia aldovae]|nr:Uncharacterised protein [Yersinia aldovae]
MLNINQKYLMNLDEGALKKQRLTPTPLSVRMLH